MKIKCNCCIDGIASDGSSCDICGGDGDIDLTDTQLSNHNNKFGIHGQVWDVILTLLTDISGYLTGGVKNRLIRIETKVDEIKTVIDAL